MNTHALHLTRRAFLGRASRGVGALALASLMNPALLRAASLAAPDYRLPRAPSA